MPLPTAPTPPQARMGKVLLHAEPKVGKSTLAGTLDPEHTILLDVEDGLSAIGGYKHKIKSWGRVIGTTGEGREQRAVHDDESLMGVGRLLATEEHPFTIGVIDTADALAQLCSEYVLAQLGANTGATGFVHASDFDYGKGWSAISAEWALRIAALARVLPSLILISHSDRRTRTTRAGAEYDAYTTNLGPKGVKEWTSGFVDHILFLHIAEVDGEEVRAIRTAQGIGWQAGGRTIAGGPKLPDPIILRDAATSGKVLREALEQVTGPAPQGATEDDVDSEVDGAPKPEPAAKRAVAKPKATAKPKAAAKPAAAAPVDRTGETGKETHAQETLT